MRSRTLLVCLVVCLALAGCRSLPPTETLPPATVAPLSSTPTTALSTPVSDELARALYRDPQASVRDRVGDLLSRMTLAEKVGQMTQVEKGSIVKQDITDAFIGSILSGGGGTPSPNNPTAWAEMVDGFQEYALETRLGIPLIYGVDAVHGHGNVRGATILPHNIGLGAADDVELMERIGQVTALEMIATGIYWNFGPVVAVPQDIRWGRTYEGYGESTDLVSRLAVAYLQGMQNVDGETDLGAPTTVLGTPKHFVGDGGTTRGSSTMEVFEVQYMLDQGVTDVDEATLRAVHLSPYKAVVDAGAMSIMVSFSSWGGMKMHAQKYLLTDVLKGELGFEGFLVSDWQAIDQIPGDYYSDIVTSINAGIDMVMVPYDYGAFIDGLTEAVENGDVPVERVDNAARRILSAKFELGLFERPFADRSLLPLVGSDEHRQLARRAVRESLVLLKNEDRVVPLSKDTPLIVVAGRAADDVGIQCGGWTIEWQGKAGKITPGTTLLEGIRAAASDGKNVLYDVQGRFDVEEADVGIVVVGELPYTEGVGDRADLSLSKEDLAIIERVRLKCVKLVVILVSGRPMIVTDQMDDWDALIGAWLPGTEGQGVADVLFGDYPFTGRLPYTWPRSMDQLPFDLGNLATSGDEAPLFPFGYGLE